MKKEPSAASGSEVVFLFTAFIAATYGFGVYLFPAIVEAIRVEIPFTYGTLGTISGLVQAGFMISAIAAGLLTLRYGPVPLILGSVITCALCLAGLAFAPNVVIISILLIVLGCCAVIVWVPMVEVARDVVSTAHQGKALGLMSSGTSYGVFVNSVLMITILPVYGWRWVWATTAFLVGVLALISIIRLRTLYARQSSNSNRDVANTIPLKERFTLLAKPLPAVIFLMMFLNGLSCMPFQTYLSAFLQGEANLSQVEAASAWRIVGIVGMVSGVVVGALADRISVRHAMTITYLILVSACLTLINVPSTKGDLLLIISAICFGTAFYAVFGLVPAYISQVFGKGNAAIVFSFGNIALGLGGIVGNIAGGILKEATGTFNSAYIAMAIAASLSALLSILMPSERKFRTPTERKN
ncbi:hypothetical protein C0V75_21800 [Tabrizicola sp. TH137]|uniref:MFS transporter n=1 Tax=Tabrizicola sp. TH137 TaxID=2067452 RepID=UPI000C7E709D|nr:MFS transporter [Tabrizicola sp. TH137]PLL10184.1 hypothetical protein C0V75_21800 [Tabrizicola sp. TH137]